MVPNLKNAPETPVLTLAVEALANAPSTGPSSRAHQRQRRRERRAVDPFRKDAPAAAPREARDMRDVTSPPSSSSADARALAKRSR